MFVQYSVFDVFGKSLLTLYKLGSWILHPFFIQIINKIDTDPTYVGVDLYRRRFLFRVFSVFYPKDKNSDFCCLATLRSRSR